ncbi:MAG: lipocalin family protein [Pseudomonadota bacterium]
MARRLIWTGQARQLPGNHFLFTKTFFASDMMKNFLILLVVLMLAGCTGAPPGGLQIVQNFDLQRYQGDWFEIARLDHRFERGLSQVSANYTVQEDNSVRVTNRGFNENSQEWEEAIGKAKFVAAPDQGALKVSFFGPFYGAYNIVALDQENYQWVMVTGPSYDYLWILARQPTLDAVVYGRLVEIAANAGFAVDELIVVEHSPGG